MKSTRWRPKAGSKERKKKQKRKKKGLMEKWKTQPNLQRSDSFNRRFPLSHRPGYDETKQPNTNQKVSIFNQD
jgi:hypothetical protein